MQLTAIMNILVLLFFVHNIIATALLGYKFFIRKDGDLKNFGIALLLDCAAFCIWTAAVILKPSNLEFYVSSGAAFFLASLIFLVVVGTKNLKSSSRSGIILLSVVAAAIIFFIRTFIYPSSPAFSTEGLLFFNLHPFVQILYIFGLVFTAIPAIDIVSSKFKSTTANLIKFCFLIEVIGGIILMTSTDYQVLNVLGWIMGSAYFILWSTLLFSKKAWSTVK